MTGPAAHGRPAGGLTPRDRRRLRAEANRLKATVHVGREGLTDALLKALEAELAHRELVKVAVNPNAALAAADLARDLPGRLGAEWVQTLGRTVVLFRPAPPDGAAEAPAP